MNAIPENSRREAEEGKKVTRYKRKGKETEQKEKGKTEKAKERTGPLRGCSRLPGNTFPRKLVSVKEKKELKQKIIEYRSKSTTTPGRGFTSRYGLDHLFSVYYRDLHGHRLSKPAFTGDLRSCTPFYRAVCSKSFVPLNYPTGQKLSQFTPARACPRLRVRGTGRTSCGCQTDR